jgi:hypothetical protein
VWENQKKFYIGSIKDDLFDGPGKLYFENGRVVSGIWKKGHNMRVLGIEQLTESHVKNIKAEQDQQYHEFHGRSSVESRAEFNAQGSRAEFNGKASRSEYNGKGSDSRSEMSRGEDGSGHSKEHWHHGHSKFSKREEAMLKIDTIIEK